MKAPSITTGLIAALFASIASSLCCIGPLLYLLFGISAAGFTSFSQLGWLQWPMMAISLLLLGATFWRLYLSPKPYCSQYLSRKSMLVVFWLFAAFIFAALFYPFALPPLLEFFA